MPAKKPAPKPTKVKKPVSRAAVRKEVASKPAEKAKTVVPLRRPAPQTKKPSAAESAPARKPPETGGCRRYRLQPFQGEPWRSTPVCGPRDSNQSRKNPRKTTPATPAASSQDRATFSRTYRSAAKRT